MKIDSTQMSATIIQAAAGAFVILPILFAVIMPGSGSTIKYRINRECMQQSCEKK